MYIWEALNESFSSFDDSQSLEHELNEIEETFRDPNLLIETIKERHAAKTRRDIKWHSIEVIWNETKLKAI